MNLTGEAIVKLDTKTGYVERCGLYVFGISVFRQDAIFPERNRFSEWINQEAIATQMGLNLYKAIVGEADPKDRIQELARVYTFRRDKDNFGEHTYLKRPSACFLCPNYRVCQLTFVAAMGEEIYTDVRKEHEILESLKKPVDA